MSMVPSSLLKLLQKEAGDQLPAPQTSVGLAVSLHWTLLTSSPGIGVFYFLMTFICFTSLIEYGIIYGLVPVRKLSSIY